MYIGKCTFTLLFLNDVTSAITQHVLKNYLQFLLLTRALSNVARPFVRHTIFNKWWAGFSSVLWVLNNNWESFHYSWSTCRLHYMAQTLHTPIYNQLYTRKKHYTCNAHHLYVVHGSCSFKSEPGHSCVLHSCICWRGPVHITNIEASRIVQVLALACFPPPHILVHGVHSLHSSNPPGSSVSPPSVNIIVSQEK